MTDIEEKILSLKHQKNAIILAHYYQTMDIQKIADYVGDSFELARLAQKAEQPIIILCGVRFMAESAKILNPGKKVLQPSPDAGCPMADMITPSDVKKLKKQYPDAAVVCYINSSAAVKAESDICCTSSSAVRIVQSVDQKQIIFIPDKNLGAYVASKVSDKEIILFQGHCPVHNFVSTNDVVSAKTAHPNAHVLVHPECPAEILASADYIGSTSGILNYVKESPSGSEFIIGTESGIIERIHDISPDRLVYPLANNMFCKDMKMTKIEDVLKSLEDGIFEVTLSEYELKGAAASLKRMIQIQQTKRQWDKG